MTMRERAEMLEAGTKRLHQTINDLRNENTGLRARLSALLGEDGTFQARNAAWLAQAMSDDPTDLAERVARFGEEALELQQALGQTRDEAHALVDYVHGRPVGVPAQEMGGTMTTLALLGVVAGLDMVECGETELARCSTPHVLAKIRAKRATRHGRGPLPGTIDPEKEKAAAHALERHGIA